MSHSERSPAEIARRYPHVVHWSDEDRMYIGSCPPLMYGGCHGDDPAAVLSELRTIIDGVVRLYLEDGKPLPEPTVWLPKEAA